MVAGVFEELARERPRRRFTVGINDDVSGTSLAYDPSLDIEPPDTVRAVFFGLGSDGTVGANKNTIKILGVRGEPARPGLLRLRLEEVGLADRVAPALRAAADPGAVPGAARELRRLPPLRAARSGRRARPGGARRDAAAQLPAPAGRGLGCAVAARPGADPRQAHRGLRDRRRPDRPRGRPCRADQHRAADLLLRDLRRAAARRGDRQDQGGDREDLRTARRRGGRDATTRRSTRRSRGCTRSRCPTG